MSRSSGILLLAAVFAAFVAVFVARAALQPSPLERASDALVDHYQPGDIIVVHPATRHLELGAFSPMPAVAVDDLPADIASFDRVFLVTEAGDEGAMIREGLGALGRRVWETDVDGISVQLVQLPARPQLVRDLVSSIDDAVVTVGRAGRRPCIWNGTGFDCTPSNAARVGPATASFGDEPFACTEMRAPPGRSLDVAYDGILGASHIDGWFGPVGRVTGASDSTFAVFVDDVELYSSTLESATRRPLRLPVPSSTRGEIRFELVAGDETSARVCWSLRAVRLPGGDG